MEPQTMVVNSVAYKAGKRLNDITIDDISDVVKEPDTFVWLGLWQPEDAFMRKIQEEFSLHDLAIEDALCAHQRPKIETYGDSLFIVVKTAQWEKEEVEYGETHFFVGKNFLITVRHGASSSYTPIRVKAEENPKLLSHGPGFALYSVLDFIVDNYRHIVGKFEMMIEDIESNMFKSEFDETAIENVYSLRRHLLGLRNAALPMDEICNQLIHLHDNVIHKELRAYVRDVQDHARHVASTLDDMREMLTNAMHVNLALVTVKQNEVVKRLAGWGAILAIPTVIFSLYGMNFADMPELKFPWAYHTTLGVTVIGCIFLYRKLKRSGWL
ncbi:magnesium transporter [Chania multitudinisentens RB-25]|uniref:Magnesium transporter n=1 Tax=Chania multitudinisentens RB-25 TaxID=1441930 RepID=W0LDI0_9GAMM|nr:magnesium and cobalt transport protein CorA [Chania multitudinisentens]AHG21878.2 magnesium transporter [Chania multitudinisentens RB-25]